MQMTTVPTPDQHRALLRDCRHLIDQLPDSGVLNSGGKPYRALRVERKLADLGSDPVGLLEYVRGMASRWSEGLDALVLYNRLDLALETLILDESKIYAPLFTNLDRAAARDKFARWGEQVAELTGKREREFDEADRRVIQGMNERRESDGRPRLTAEQEASVLENRRKERAP
jgi:hypothetical protein